MNLYATDKEYKERFDYFLEEVKNDEGNKLDEPTRYLAVLSVLMGNQGICAYEEVLEKALGVLSSVQVKEMVYQATDYLGYGRMLEFLKVTNEVTPLSSLHFIHDWSQIDQNQATFSIDHLSMDNLLQVLTEYQIQKLEILPPTLEELFMRHYQVQK